MYPFRKPFESSNLPGGIDGADAPDLELGELQQFLDQIQEAGGISFSGLMGDLAKGDLSGAVSRVFLAFREGILWEMTESVKFLAQTAALGILGAVFARIAAVFPSGRITETGFFITYLLAFTCLTASFFTSVETAKTVVATVLDFMKILLPAFFLAVSLAGGSLSAAALYGCIFDGS